MSCNTPHLSSLPDQPKRALAKAFFIFALLIATVSLTSGPISAEYRVEQIDRMAVSIWEPATLPAPIIIFSHGFGGCATQSKFLTEAFEQRGYWVFAPNHKDARCGSKGGGFLKPEQPFREPEIWSSSSYRDRRDDILRLITTLTASEKYRDRIDWNRLGLVGHSLGGYTILGLGGGWPDWKLKDAQPKALLALSPYVAPFISHKNLSELVAPVMYQGGTRDLGITPSLKRAKGAFDQSSSPKYFVEFEKAGHFSWSDLNTTAHPSIIVYSLAFFDFYLRGIGTSALPQPKPKDVTQLTSAVGNQLLVEETNTSAKAARNTLRTRVEEKIRERWRSTHR